MRLIYKQYMEPESLIETRTQYILKGKIKKFDQKLFDKYDIPARTIVKEKLGALVYDNPDIYGQDLVLNDKECKYKYIELQVCASWITDDDYPFKKPFVYERKG